MPDAALLQKLDNIVRNMHDLNVRYYLNEASKCFKAEAYDGAIVMAWGATVAHLIAQVRKIGLEVFQYGFSQEYPERKKIPNTPEDLVGDDDRSFVQVCKQMCFLSVKSENLQRFRVRRNKSAHLNPDRADEYVAREFLELCLAVVNLSIEDTRILDGTLLVDYALKNGRSAETIVSLIHPDCRVPTATRLMGTYLNSEPNEGKNYDALVSVWYRLWDTLTEIQRDTLWPTLEIEVERAIQGHNDFRNCEDVARFIVWPEANQEHSYRDVIARHYVDYAMQKVRDGFFAAEDKVFLRWLYDKLPEAFQYQIVTLYTKWLVNRVKRDDFNGADLDFNSWLKEQSFSNQQIRFQIIRDAIVRRYIE